MVESSSIAEQIYFVSVGRVRDQTILATSKTSNQIQSDMDQDIRDHSMTLLCRQNNQISGSRSKTEHMGFSWHLFQDKNMISYVIVTNNDLNDEYATNFLRGLSSLLYDRHADFRANPQTIASLDGQARLVINDLLSNFDGSAISASTFQNPNLGGGIEGDGRAATVQRTLDAVTGRMRDNISKLFDNQTDLEAMGSKSEGLRDTANQFQLSSARLEKIARQRRVRAYMMIFAMVSVFLLMMYYLMS